MRVPLLAAAREQDFGETRLERIRVIGDWQSLCVPDFKPVEQVVDLLRLLPLPRPALNWLRRQWTLRPQIIDGRCTRCGICEKDAQSRHRRSIPMPRRRNAWTTTAASIVTVATSSVRRTPSNCARPGWPGICRSKRWPTAPAGWSVSSPHRAAARVKRGSGCGLLIQQQPSR